MAPTGNTTQLQSLIDLAARGDDKAHGELVAQASARLLKLTRKMLRDFPRLQRWEATDDVFQTAALRLCRSLSEVRPASVREFFGLAALQIRRTLVDLARRHYGPEGHGAKHHSDGDGAVLRQTAAVSPDCLEDWVRFHEAVARLPEAEREVFQLVWYGGLPQAEAAGLLGISIPTLQRRWYRAQRRLFAAGAGESPWSES